jgi:D-glycerate 3-kinase
MQLRCFIDQAQLPQDYLNTIEQYLLPLAAWIRQQKQGKPLVVGINGAQGTGKSTMSAALQLILENQGYKVAVLSLDDFYLSHHQRLELAASIHPLFKTRGVPGTHDVALAISTIKQLIQGKGKLLIPRFDKQTDNPKAKHNRDVCEIPIDIVLFEGWCVATPSQKPDELIKAVNDLEAEEDKKGVWRRYVNDRLNDKYLRLFSLLDRIIFLQAPSFAAVLDWRYKQEQQTFSNAVHQGMNKQQLSRFMSHYKRLTLQSLDKLPSIADVVFKLDNKQKISSSKYV